MIARYLTIAAFLIICLQHSNALKWNPEEFEHDECATVHPDPSLNMTWLTSQDHWYFHAFSKPTLYEAMHYITTPEEFASLTDEQVQESCFMITRISPEKKIVKAFGLNRTFFDWEVSFPKYRKGVIDFAITKPVVQYAMTSYVVFTDNKSYFVGINIFEDGAKGFFLVSPLSELPPGEMDKIKKFLARHKFPESSFYPLHTDCEHDPFLNNIKKELNLS